MKQCNTKGNLTHLPTTVVSGMVKEWWGGKSHFAFQKKLGKELCALLLATVVAGSIAVDRFTGCLVIMQHIDVDECCLFGALWVASHTVEDGGFLVDLSHTCMCTIRRNSVDEAWRQNTNIHCRLLLKETHRLGPSWNPSQKSEWDLLALFREAKRISFGLAFPWKQNQSWQTTIDLLGKCTTRHSVKHKTSPKKLSFMSSSSSDSWEEKGKCISHFLLLTFFCFTQKSSSFLSIHPPQDAFSKDLICLQKSLQDATVALQTMFCLKTICLLNGCIPILIRSWNAVIWSYHLMTFYKIDNTKDRSFLQLMWWAFKWLGLVDNLTTMTNAVFLFSLCGQHLSGMERKQAPQAKLLVCVKLSPILQMSFISCGLACFQFEQRVSGHVWCMCKHGESCDWNCRERTVKLQLSCLTRSSYPVLKHM